MSTFTYHKPGIGNASSYIVSGTPWCTSSLAPALSTTSTVINLPRVTNYLTVKNNSTTNDTLRFTLNDDNVVDNTNYITLEGGESFSAELRVVDVQLISDSETPVPFTILAGLTNIDRKEMYGTVPSAPNLLAWVQKQKLVANDPDGSPEGDLFSWNVTMNIDGDLLAIGAMYDEQGEEQKAGLVYLFKELNGEYQQVQILTASTDAPKAESLFGAGCAITKDKEKIFVSAYRSNDKLTDAGSVYVFQTSSFGYQQTQIITSSGDADPAGDRFGGQYDVAVSGDGNTVAIPAANSDENGTNAGSVYIFVSGSTGYTEVQKLTASGADFDPAGDYFGQSVSIDENAQVIAIGAWAEQISSTGQHAAGTVYIFESGSNGYSQTQKLEADQWGWFGYSIKLTADGEKLVVAARYENHVDKNRVGTVSVFKRNSNQYVLEQKIVPEFNNEYQNISRVDISEDGSVILAISTQYETGNQDYDNTYGTPREGVAFIFQSGSNGYEQFQKLTIDGPLAAGGSEIGGLTDGSMNGQGTRILIGRPYETEQGGESRSTAKGAAYIYKYTRDY